MKRISSPSILVANSLLLVKGSLEFPKAALNGLGSATSGFTDALSGGDRRQGGERGGYGQEGQRRPPPGY